MFISSLSLQLTQQLYDVSAPKHLPDSSLSLSSRKVWRTLRLNGTSCVPDLCLTQRFSLSPATPIPLGMSRLYPCTPLSSMPKSLTLPQQKRGRFLSHSLSHSELIPKTEDGVGWAAVFLPNTPRGSLHQFTEESSSPFISL